MEVSMDSDFNASGVDKVSLSRSVLSEVEDGELIEDTNINNVTEEEKRVLRAKRFGANDNANIQLQDPKLQRLHKRMKTDKDTRLEAIHLHGTDNMKTEDVFALFYGYAPASIEWITDKTCNAVWLDPESCAKALKNCSVRIKEQSSEDSGDDTDEEFINKEDIRCALPSGVIWRRGHPTQLAPNLFMRFAAYTDKRGNKSIHYFGDHLRKNNIVFLDEGDEGVKKFRPDTGNPWVDIAREWSHYEMRVAAKKQDERIPVRDARELLTRVDRMSEVRGKRSSVDGYKDEDASAPTERIILGRKMQADIEEKKILSKKLKSQYNKLPTSIDLRERLSRSRNRKDYFEDGCNNEDKINNEGDSYKQGPGRRKRHTNDLWIRGDVSEESEDEDSVSSVCLKTDLRSKLRKYSEPIREEVKKRKSSVLTKSSTKFVPDCPLQIEIDNDIYYERMNRK